MSNIKAQNVKFRPNEIISIFKLIICLPCFTLNESTNHYSYSEKEKTMPFVNIKVTKGGVTAEQKQQLIRGATQLLVDVLNKNPKTTFVVIDEVDTDNWGVGGESITELRKKE